MSHILEPGGRSARGERKEDLFCVHQPPPRLLPHYILYTSFLHWREKAGNKQTNKGTSFLTRLSNVELNCLKISVQWVSVPHFRCYGVYLVIVWGMLESDTLSV